MPIVRLSCFILATLGQSGKGTAASPSTSRLQLLLNLKVLADSEFEIQKSSRFQS